MSWRYGNCDRRYDPRWDLGLGLKGSIVLGISAPTRPCLIKNISNGGARLDIGLLLDLPNRFALLTSSPANRRRECRLVWRSEFEAGIKLLDRCLQSGRSEPSGHRAGTLHELRRRAFPRGLADGMEQLRLFEPGRWHEPSTLATAALAEAESAIGGLASFTTTVSSGFQSTGDQPYCRRRGFRRPPASR
jgi:hypothetical protein